MIDHCDHTGPRRSGLAPMLQALSIAAAAILVASSSPLSAQDQDKAPTSGTTSQQVHIGTFRTGPDAKTPPSPHNAQPSDGTAANEASRQKKRAQLLAGALKDLDAGRTKLARRQLEVLVARYPDSLEADTARAHLSKLYAAAIPNRAPATALNDRTTANPPTKPPRLDHTVETQPLAPLPAVNEPLSQALGLAVGDRVFFPEGSDKLGFKARAVLKHQARWLQRRAGLSILVAGHAHEFSDNDHNLAISKRRAVAVRNRLIEEGVARQRIKIRAFGRANPIATCDTPLCAAQNRRVVTSILQGSSQRVRARPHPNRQ